MAAQPPVNIWSHLSLSEDGQVEQSLGELCGNHVSLGEKVSRQMSSRETQWVDKEADDAREVRGWWSGMRGVWQREGWKAVKNLCIATSQGSTAFRYA